MIGERLDFDALEAMGHDFTLVAPVHAGRSCYICENCGAFMLATMDAIEIWHHPHRDDPACEPGHVRRKKLYDKLRSLDLRDLERLEAI